MSGDGDDAVLGPGQKKKTLSDEFAHGPYLTGYRFWSAPHPSRSLRRRTRRFSASPQCFDISKKKNARNLNKD